VVNYATIDRSAFTLTTFADPGVQPLRMTDRYWQNYRRLPGGAWELLPALALESRRIPHLRRVEEEVRLSPFSTFFSWTEIVGLPDSD
jgi:hypothetical protein